MSLVLILVSVKSMHVSTINFLVIFWGEYVSHHNIYILRTHETFRFMNTN